ncbi:MAG TPA: DUF2182 domain-containing protein, partial [Candidatus Dormibacteraeota bacterium]|nr:DUF2182 domain-containing protein [Candidatus Dormibacteraeota bacterium]
MAVGSVQSFLLTWTAMTAAMMAPSVSPFVVSFARRLDRRLPALVILAAAYLFVWVGFGVAVYYALPWAMLVPAGAAIAFIGLYAFTPLMRLGQARGIAMCRRQ